MVIASCIFIITTILIFPESCAQSARSALEIWGLDVVPSLFPYMVFCRMLSERLKQTRFPAPALVCFLGLFGGSPSGASVLSACHERLSGRQQRILCALTGTISPMFLTGTVTGWARNASLGIPLFSAHLFGTFFAAGCAAALPVKKSENFELNSAQSKSNACDPIRDSIHGILSIGGCIVVFSVLSGICAMLPGISPFSAAIIHAVLEAAGGMHKLAIVPLNPFSRAVLLAAVSGFSGLSIIFQNLSFARPLGIGLKQLLLYAIMRAIGAAACMSVFCQLSML